LVARAARGSHGLGSPFGKGQISRWLLFVVAWLGFALLFAAQSISSYGGPAPNPVARTLGNHLLEAAYWALASWLLHRAAALARAAPLPAAGGVLVSSVALATMGAIAWNVIQTWLLQSRHWPFALWDLLQQSAASTFAYGVLLSVMLLAASTAVHLTDEAQERALNQAKAEAALMRQRLEMLTLHLQPHFLFNTLNTIVGLVPTQPQQAVDIVHRLSGLLRAAIQNAGSMLVPLEQELRLVDQYLGIARVRYGDRLVIEVQVGADLGNVPVPLMLLQPLLENALQHTVECRSGPGLVRLTVRGSEHELELAVEDDGVGLAADPLPRATTGIGLATTRARLALLFGERAGLSLSPSSPSGARALIRMPRQIHPGGPATP
jgi:two-component system, LytTR family, sensor kinase